MHRSIGFVSFLIASTVMAAPDAVLDLRPERVTLAPFFERMAPPQQSFSEQSFVLSSAELDTLRGAGMGQQVDLPSLNLGLAKGAPMRFRRINIYAAGARITELGVDGPTVVPRSGRLFFLGKNAGGSAGLALDPASGRINGTLIEGTDTYSISSTAGKSGGLELHLVNHAVSEKDSVFQCELGADHQSLSAPQSLSQLYPSRNATPKGGALLYQTDIAIDTDNEFMSNKFSNNTANAQTWIEDLFLAMNAFFEPDLQMRLLQGNTTLRTAADPYSGSNDLNEFGQYWIDNNQGIARDFVMMLSGQGVGSNSFSGVAWVNAYCVSTQVFNAYGSYSFNRIGTNLSASFSSGGIGHEIGHNLGSRHTHCEQLANGNTEFVDQCYSCEDNNGSTCDSSCYVGPTMCVSGGVAPLVNTGSLMSYCHAGANGFDGGGLAEGTAANCATADRFHPLIIGKLNGLIVANNPSCIDNFDGATPIFADGFE